MLIFGFYIAQNNKNPHVTLFKHCISKTARYSILTPLVKKSYLGDKLLNPEYQVIGSESVNTPPGPSVGGGGRPFWKNTIKSNIFFGWLPYASCVNGSYI